MLLFLCLVSVKIGKIEGYFQKAFIIGTKLDEFFLPFVDPRNHKIEHIAHAKGLSRL